MNIGPFYVDIDAINLFFATEKSPAIIAQVIALGGWLILFYMLFLAGSLMWVEYKESRYTKHWKWVLLAIDIPLLNIQTPKAVEQIFAHLAGAYERVNIAKKFWHGYKQPHFSFEIISIEGYIQFLVRTEASFRDLMEAAIYAQYPEAEITEVEDYVESAPVDFPDESNEMWGSDFALTQSDAYPIRTYEEFEHSISKDTALKDPMAAILESFTRLGPGEQMWFQILIQPTGSDWKEKIIDRVKELIGAKARNSGGSKIADFMTDLPLKFLEFAGEQVFGGEAGTKKESKEKEGPPSNILYLTPGERKMVESMEGKMSKIGFKTKMRGIYLARKEVFKTERGVSALIGAINQFNIPSANSIAPTFGVHASYVGAKWRESYRKRLLMKAYKKRKMNAGANPFILNIEELATIWHFPMSHIKTPLLQKTEGKRAEPPAGLPIETVAPPEEIKEDGSSSDRKQEMKFG